MPGFNVVIAYFETMMKGICMNDFKHNKIIEKYFPLNFKNRNKCNGIRKMQEWKKEKHVRW